ncbi:MAG: aminoacetone oxidase family FAD-binding enzyme [Bacteroidetes bacterium]|nr:aminoacetone oxidase family FAD-binding enzyme [Bacteroidota bacterium]
MSAISAKRAGADQVLLLDASERPGTKIVMSGGGRCNLTNAELDFRDFRGESANGIKKVILQFPPEKVIQFFNSLGVKTKTEEPWHKIFPVSDSAQTVLSTLLNEVRKNHVNLKFPEKVISFSFDKSLWKVTTQNEVFLGRSLVLAPGGFSYPHTGSDGVLWKVLEKLGVSLVSPKAALTTLKCSDQDLHTLSGLTIWCRFRVRVDGKVIFNQENSLLFTHDGLSGPGILNASEWFTGNDLKKPAELSISFFPNENENEIRDWLGSEIKKTPASKLIRLLKTKLPERLAVALENRLDSPDISIGHLSKEKRNKLIELLTDFKPVISGHSGYKKAEVTAGGIPFSELNLATMEFKRFPGLYAAGEIVNVHGIIGGYNFQWAWSSGWVAGKSASEKINGG